MTRILYRDTSNGNILWQTFLKYRRRPKVYGTTRFGKLLGYDDLSDLLYKIGTTVEKLQRQGYVVSFKPPRQVRRRRDYRPWWQRMGF